MEANQQIAELISEAESLNLKDEFLEVVQSYKYLYTKDSDLEVYNKAYTSFAKMFKLT